MAEHVNVVSVWVAMPVAIGIIQGSINVQADQPGWEGSKTVPALWAQRQALSCLTTLSAARPLQWASTSRVLINNPQTCMASVSRLDADAHGCIFGPIATNVCACLRKKYLNESHCKVWARQVGPGMYQQYTSQECEECQNVKLAREQQTLHVTVDPGSPERHVRACNCLK